MQNILVQSWTVEPTMNYLYFTYEKGGTGIRTQDNGFANRGLSPLGDAANYIIPKLRR